ncbi:hypothetical protein KR51_00032800 [Rubidibacter lacunae KORDI 51-2]|uniref:Putative zinc-finger domain-containing protein n=1 Tax=Rubidibacter lacunae KORDI 51-2 TaxID=582515 RepID=U5DFF3_9CHRO|nr:zf-HC2 domain-containing protein [Rubidibacter lacunae]ERN40331.1 hypothetical protein KR51_00032800 [Rubidibacter lacunae KORDI 51-2]
MATNVQHEDEFGGCSQLVLELLSAYLDGEVTQEEEARAQALIASSPAAERFYRQQLKLRAALRQVAVPREQSVAALEGRVWTVCRRRRRWLWGGSAAAALLVGTFAWLVGGESSVLRLARSPQPALSSGALAISLDRPVLALPELEAGSLVAPNPR